MATDDTAAVGNRKRGEKTINYTHLCLSSARAKLQISTENHVPETRTTSVNDELRGRGSWSETLAAVCAPVMFLVSITAPSSGNYAHGAATLHPHTSINIFYF